MRAHSGNPQKAHVAIPRNFIGDFGLIFPFHFLTFVTHLCINVFGCFGLRAAKGGSTRGPVWGLSRRPPLMAGGKEALTEYRTYASFYDSINWPFATQTEAVRNTLLHNPAHVANKSKEFV